MTEPHLPSEFSQPSTPAPAPTARAERVSKPVAVWVVTVILALIFVAECVLALLPIEGLFDIDSATLVSMGALDRVFVAQGQWYRFFTAALLHGGLMHLVLNGISLLFAGLLLETLVGHSRFLVTWLLGALGGTALSLVTHDAHTISIGASGAGMAILAATFMTGFRLEPGPERQSLQVNMLRFLVPSLLPFATHGGGGVVDIAAHVGGAVVGFAVGTLLWLEPPRFSRVLNPVMTGLAVLLSVLCVGSAVKAGLDFPALAVMSTEHSEAERYKGALPTTCRLGSKPSCALVGEQLAIARDPQAQADAIALLEPACAATVQGSCFNLATALFNESPVRDVTRAAHLWNDTCEGGDPAGCFNAALALRNLPEPKRTADIARLETKACDGKIFKACFNLATESDDATAVTLYTRACDGADPESCTNLGLRYAVDGRGVAKDLKKAAALFKRGCDLDDGLGCFEYGLACQEALGVAANEPEAITWFTRGCELKELRACRELERARLIGRGLSADPAEAVKNLDALCTQGEGNSCGILGDVWHDGLGVTADVQKAAAAYQRACALGINEACPHE